MRLRWWPLLVALSLLVCAVPGSQRAEADAEETGSAAARGWLSVIDQGDYSQSWKDASAYFRGAVAETQWVASLEGFRKPLGKLLSRKVKTANQTTSVPGAPDGQYVITDFETSFENKKSAVETVTFMLQNDGKWKAAGYVIK